MVSTIGLKVANGEFYSIVEENSEMKKRLILTTVHDNQQSVQIDLYKSSTRTMADALYIGSMVMENIKPRPRGEPSIELVISSANNGDITADAADLDATMQGERQSLSVSLRSLEENGLDDEIPDFELEPNEPTPRGLYENTETTTGLYKETAETGFGGESKKFPWLVVICAALILTAIGLVVWIFFFQNGGNLDTAAARIRQAVPGRESESPAQVSESPATPPPPAQPAQQAQQPARPATPPPVIQAPAQAPATGSQARRERVVPPVASYNVPSVIPQEGVPYRIRYGDTLWDIAEAFYRNPWLYPRIARFNNIRNPDLIISGTTIRVPPRN